MKPRPLWVVLSFLCAGAALGFFTRRHSPGLSSHPVASVSTDAWTRLSPDRKKAIAEGHRRFLAMTVDEQRLIRNRWQYYRHLPAWRQEEMLRQYEAWRRANPQSVIVP